MADSKTYRLQKSLKGGWEVWADGARRPTSTHRTKREAQGRLRALQESSSRSTTPLPASAARKLEVSAVLKNLEHLSREDLQQVAQKVAALARSRHGQFPPVRRSLAGSMADLGPPPTAEEIEQARREMWGRLGQASP